MAPVSIDIVFAVVRWQFVGFHRWPKAPEATKYLRDRHRHVFHCQAVVQQDHADREIEYHYLLGLVEGITVPTELGTQSCEMIAQRITTELSNKYPGRMMTVSVYEDNENGAVIQHTPERFA